MSKDGLLPPVFSAVHPKFRTPWLASAVTGVLAMVFAGLLPIGLLGELVSIGTLLAFAIVCAGVLVLRYTDPERPRPFRTPLVPLVPILGDRRLRLPDGRPAGGHLGPTHHLDGARPRDLFPLRPPAFEGGAGGAVATARGWDIIPSAARDLLRGYRTPGEKVPRSLRSLGMKYLRSARTVALFRRR